MIVDFQEWKRKKNPYEAYYAKRIEELEPLIRRNINDMIETYYDKLEVFQDLGPSQKSLQTIFKEAQRRKRRRKQGKAAAAVACLAAVVAGAWLLFDPVPGTANGDGAENWMVFDENSGIVRSARPWVQEIGEEYFSDDVASIALYKSRFDAMLVPGYIPAGYQFRSVELNNDAASFYVCYVYEKDSDDQLIVNQYISYAQLYNVDIYDANTMLDTRWGNVYLQTDIHGVNGATLLYGDSLVSIYGKIEADDLLSILEGLLS